MTSPAPNVWPSILTDYKYDSELDIADGVPRSVSTQRLVPSGNHGYIRSLGRFLNVNLSKICNVAVVFFTVTFWQPRLPFIYFFTVNFTVYYSAIY